MRIAYIAAGAAGMLCGSCIHDNTLAAAIRRRGGDIALIPTYTPIRTDEADISLHRVFYGGVNVYLQQKFGVFRHTPWAFDALLDRPSLLNALSRFSSSTNARDLGSLTVSVLQGEQGRQRKELAKLVRWLKEDFRPDIVQLTNSMFVGFAREMKKALGVPVLCAVQGEDLFLDDLIEPCRSQARAALRERAADVDGFIAASEYYADHMSDYLAVARERFHVVRLGVNLDGFGVGAPSAAGEPFTVGYLARICPEKGLHLLIDAFIALSERVGKGSARLRVAGYLGKKDEPFFREHAARIERAGLAESFEHWGEIDRAGKIRFLNSLHALAVPTIYREAKGLFALEAMANGVPVVLPRHGGFPEMIDATGGGLLTEPESPESVADALMTLMKDSPFRERLGQQGKEAVHARFSDDVMASETIAVYESYLPRTGSNGERGNR